MADIRLNEILDKVEPSRSVMLLAKVREMQKQDPSICNLTGGEPDFDTPKPICDEVYQQLLNGCTHYGDSKGDPALREAIARKLADENHAPYSPDQILITPGGKFAVYAVVKALLNPGDEVLWLTPGWVSYPAIVTLCGGIPVAVRLNREEGYRITCDTLESHTTSRTKLLIINYPNNPTGKILSAADLEELRNYMRKHPDVLCLSDEIYEKIIYDGLQHISPASDPELHDRVIIVNGFSKASAMTGWRIGYLACNPEIYRGVLKIFQHTMSCTSGFIQKGAIVALSLQEETERMRTAYERRRNMILEGIRDIPNLSLDRPEGSFYAWIRFDTPLSSEELSSRLLEEAGIGGIPGSAFGEEEECMVRFCYAANDQTIARFIERLRKFCLTL